MSAVDQSDQATGRSTPLCVVGDATVFTDHVAINGELIQLDKVEAVAAEKYRPATDRHLNFVFWAGLIALALGLGEMWASGWVLHRGSVTWAIVGLAGLIYSLLKTSPVSEDYAVILRTASREIVVMTHSDSAMAEEARDRLSSALARRER